MATSTEFLSGLAPGLNFDGGISNDILSSAIALNAGASPNDTANLVNALINADSTHYLLRHGSTRGHLETVNTDQVTNSDVETPRDAVSAGIPTA